jgi:hypothetical protein
VAGYLIDRHEPIRKHIDLAQKKESSTDHCYNRNQPEKPFLHGIAPLSQPPIARLSRVHAHKTEKQKK